MSHKVFDDLKIDLGEFGYRYCTFHCTVSTERLRTHTASNVIIEKLEVWSDQAERLIDLTSLIDSPGIRQRLQSIVEAYHESELAYEERNNWHNDDPGAA